MRELWMRMEQALTAGRDLILVTVTAATGATPRGAGARMLVDRDSVWGTIGGGAVEYRAQQMARELLETKRCQEQEFALNRKDVENLGMVCGGAARVFFQYIPAGDDHTLSVARAALDYETAKENVWLVSDLANGGRLDLYTRDNAPKWLQGWLRPEPCRVEEGTLNCYVEQILCAGRVYIFGGGHVARALEPVLTRVGFHCVVLDDRPEFADPAQFPTAESVLCISFDRVDDFVSIGPEDYVCVMTRGHAADTEVEARVLCHHPRYNGMIGSRPKGAVVRRTLREQYGYDDAAIGEIISPIGLPIGGKTPEEIAISIAAQMIAVRAGKDPESL